MNERIKELWVQSTQTVVPRDGDWSSVSAQAIQKFAESLIKEGADVMARSDRYRGRAFADDLMVHFGVVPERHDWVIKKVEGTKDKFYVEHGEPPLHVLRTYGIV
jgi:hypothetical protein